MYEQACINLDQVQTSLFSIVCVNSQIQACLASLDQACQTSFQFYSACHTCQPSRNFRVYPGKQMLTRGPVYWLESPTIWVRLVAHLRHTRIHHVPPREGVRSSTWHACVCQCSVGLFCSRPLVFTEHFSLVGRQKKLFLTHDIVLRENQFFNSKTSEIWAYDQSLFVLKLAGMTCIHNIVEAKWG